jgi:hypothetical protein
MARRIVLGAVVLGGVLVAVFAGWGGLIVYGFFTGIAAALALAAGVGGGWIKGASRGRFDDRGR